NEWLARGNARVHALNARLARSERLLATYRQNSAAFVVANNAYQEQRQQYHAAYANALRNRGTRGEYEIDSSSFIQLADNEPGWQNVQGVLLNNRGKVFLSTAAK